MSTRPFLMRAVIIVAVIQVLALITIPLFAGAWIPDGTDVVLEATPKVVTRGSDSDGSSDDIELTYGFEHLKVPPRLAAGQTVYVQLATHGDAPASYERVVSDLGDLPKDAIWLRLALDDRGQRIDPLSLRYYWGADAEQRTLIRTADKVHVRVALAGDGSPSIDDVLRADD